ncbi:hypothetical protein PHLGIDRAFT_126951 [Phlebiopsis gigantea 11061_1 CR5-6]|uniref:Uncharacterized protein n=1 Tax=Phlebiopsis gigantea (strain 11061_1 CR5-6) TaxID=745531 RepID=A0A0C3S9R5_PHLG1|nr:hypothetical protein PHLGIDRAFT_126951 [Phlebiopsis gigantea 11061_1 CR5-6]
MPMVLGADTPYLNQGFMFDWTPANQSPPVPTTAQCETLHIEFGRGTATGPNPVAPYFLQVYTSAFIVPFVIPAGDSNSALTVDWPVPFIPGTQYQICMFDSNGVTGGCQAIYAVYPAANTTLDNPPVCTNLTYPHPNQVLGVTALVDNGALGQYAWIDQCTDISLTPTNGTPPYTMTVAPALHPPYNITSNSMDAINWTVSLSWGMPFFVSLVDSSGMSWAYGPLHSGQGSDTSCLSDSVTPISTPTEIKPWVAAVSGVGGLLVGLIVGILGAFFMFKRRRSQHGRIRPDTFHRKSSSISITTPVLRTSSNDPYTDIPSPPVVSSHLRDPSYRIEPFVMPSDHELGVRSTEHGTDSTSGTMVDSTHNRTLADDRSRSPPRTALSPTAASTQGHVGAPLVPPQRPLSAEQRSASQIFVVHHDGGRPPPVTVYAANGDEIVELPPRYAESNRNPNNGPSARSGLLPPLQIQERRDTPPVPPKTRRSRVVN